MQVEQYRAVAENKYAGSLFDSYSNLTDFLNKQYYTTIINYILKEIVYDNGVKIKDIKKSATVGYIHVILADKTAYTVSFVDFIGGGKKLKEIEDSSYFDFYRKIKNDYDLSLYFDAKKKKANEINKINEINIKAQRELEINANAALYEIRKLLY